MEYICPLRIECPMHQPGTSYLLLLYIFKCIMYACGCMNVDRPEYILYNMLFNMHNIIMTVYFDYDLLAPINEFIM